MSDNSAHVLYDACWLVLVKQFGRAAFLRQPMESRRRLCDVQHAECCATARRVVLITPQLAATVVGFDVAEALRVAEANEELRVAEANHAG